MTEQTNKIKGEINLTLSHMHSTMYKTAIEMLNDCALHAIVDAFQTDRSSMVVEERSNLKKNPYYIHHLLKSKTSKIFQPTTIKKINTLAWTDEGTHI